jgi:hypothetical protein
MEKSYNEAKEKFKFFKKIFDGEVINEEQFNEINECPYVIVWDNGRSGIHYGLTWYSAYLVKPDYKESFNREPKENEVKDSFEFYYYRG